jgi:hypothetical protein
VRKELEVAEQQYQPNDDDREFVSAMQNSTLMNKLGALRAIHDPSSLPGK